MNSLSSSSLLPSTPDAAGVSADVLLRACAPRVGDSFTKGPLSLVVTGINAGAVSYDFRGRASGPTQNASMTLEVWKHLVPGTLSHGAQFKAA